MELDLIRKKDKTGTWRGQISSVLGVLLLGFGLGVFSKFMDYQTELPYLLKVFAVVINKAVPFRIW